MRLLIPAAVALTVTACAAAFPTAPPVGKLQAVPAVELETWIAAFRPARHTTLRFSWVANQDEGTGRGSVAIAIPDSLRLEYRAQLGAHPGDAFVLGDTAVWAQPREDVEKLVPSYDLLWGLVGVARPPRAGWKTEGHRDANRTAWRYTRGADTTEYVSWTHDGVVSLQTYVSMAGKPIGRVVTSFDESHHPSKSRLDALTNPARLDITFDKLPKALTFDPDMWLAPHS